MKSSTPKVSIGLPVYNGEKYLALALDSVLKQDFADFELIISDNASTDGTAEICKAYAARDPRIRYYRNEVNIGSAPNYEKVFRLARGEFFKWHAHDDLLLPGFLSRCFEVIDAAPPSLVLVYPRCEIIDERGNQLGRRPNSVETWEKQPYKRLAHVLRRLSSPDPIWGLIRTDVLRRTKLTGTVSYTVFYWDDCLLAEVALYGEILEIPEVLSQRRSHYGNALEMISMNQDSTVCHSPTKASRKTRQALLAWTNPSNAGKKVWLPNWEERCLEYVKRIYHTPLPLYQKLLCYGTVPVVWYWRRFITFAGYWRRKLARPLARAATPDTHTVDSV